MTRFLAAIAFICLVATPAAAQCVSVDKELETIKSHDLTATALEGEAVKAAEKLFNSIPPETDHIVGAALIVDLGNGEGVLAVGPAGAICGRIRFNAMEWPKARRLLLGETA
jgi:hypothetical protein